MHKLIYLIKVFPTTCKITTAIPQQCHCNFSIQYSNCCYLTPCVCYQVVWSQSNLAMFPALPTFSLSITFYLPCILPTMSSTFWRQKFLQFFIAMLSANLAAGFGWKNSAFELICNNFHYCALWVWVVIHFTNNLATSFGVKKLCLEVLVRFALWVSIAGDFLLATGFGVKKLCLEVLVRFALWVSIAGDFILVISFAVFCGSPFGCLCRQQA